MMRVAKILILPLVVLLGFAVFGLPSAEALTFATSPTTPYSNFWYNGMGGVIGNEFMVGDSPVNITRVGLWGSASDSHDIGIYDAGGTLLGLATVGSTASIDGSGFRWADLSSPLSLTANTNYTIAAFYSSTSADQFIGGSATIDPAFSLVGARYLDNATSLAFPTSTDIKDWAGYENVNAWFGPNFEADFASAPVPEPGTLLLLGSGLAGLAGFRARKFAKK